MEASIFLIYRKRVDKSQINGPLHRVWNLELITITQAMLLRHVQSQLKYVEEMIEVETNYET